MVSPALVQDDNYFINSCLQYHNVNTPSSTNDEFILHRQVVFYLFRTLRFFIFFSLPCTLFVSLLVFVVVVERVYLTLLLFIHIKQTDDMARGRSMSEQRQSIAPPPGLSCAEDYIRNGDRMSLYCEGCSGFLAADGITSSDVIVERLELEECEPGRLKYYPNHFERCVFTLNRIDIWDAQGLGAGTGEPLQYGQIISLRHDYSNSVLCVDRRTQSSLSAAIGCLKTRLSKAAGDRSNYFRILPRYKMRSEGDKVRRSDRIILKRDGDDHFLHVTEELDSVVDTISSPSLYWRHEVNVGNSPTEWVIHVYDSKGEDEDEATIRVGMPIALFHKEREGFATASHSSLDEHSSQDRPEVYLDIPNRANQRTYNIESLKFSVNGVWMFEHANTTLGGIVALNSGRHIPAYRIKHLASHRYLAITKDRNGENKTTLVSHQMEFDPVCSEDGDDNSYVLETSKSSIIDDDQLDIPRVEIIEPPKDSGSALSNDSGCKSLQIPVPTHSGAYTRKRSPRLPDKARGREKPSDTTLFWIDPLDDGQNTLQSSTTFIRVQHVQSKCWVHVCGGSLHAVSKKETKRIPSFHLGKRPTSSHSMSVHKVPSEATLSPLGDRSDENLSRSIQSLSFGQTQTVDKTEYQIVPTEKRAHDDVWCVIKVPQTRLLGLNTVVECKDILEQFILEVNNREDGGVPPGLIIQTKIKLQQLIDFCVEPRTDLYDSGEVPRAADQLKFKDAVDIHSDVESLPISESQELLFSQDIHAVLFGMLQPKREGFYTSRVIDDSHRLCYELLRVMVKGSSERAAKLLPSMALFRKHLGNPKYGVCDLLIELYRNNRPVLDDLNLSLVGDIVNYLTDFGLQPALLKLLSTLCICNGSGIQRNQRAVLAHLKESPRLIIDTIVTAEGEIWVRTPPETTMFGAKARQGVRKNRKNRHSITHIKEDRSRTWITLGELCSAAKNSPNRNLVSYYREFLGVLSNLCHDNVSALVDVRRWMPLGVVKVLLGSTTGYLSEYRGPRKVLDDMLAVFVNLAIHVHIIPKYPEAALDPSRLVVAWYAFEESSLSFTQPEGLQSDQLTPLLKQASLAFLRENTQQFYKEPATNRLTSSLLTFWQEVVTRKLFSTDEINELLPILSKLLNGQTDASSSDKTFVPGTPTSGDWLRRGTSRKTTLFEESRRYYNEYSAVIMQSKLLAAQVFGLRLEFEAVEALYELIFAFKEEVPAAPPASARRQSNSSNVLSPLREGSAYSCSDILQINIQKLDTHIKSACARPYLRKDHLHRKELLPICMDLASYHDKRLSHTVLTYVFKSLWFGAELAANLQQTQLLFSAESWVLFRRLNEKKQLLEALIQAKYDEQDSTNEEECRALLGELVSLLQPRKEEKPTQTHRSARSHTSDGLLSESPGGSFKKVASMRKRPRAGSMVRSQPQVLLNHESVIRERQEICRNLGFHEIVAEHLLSRTLTSAMASKRKGRWELFQLCYTYLKLLVHDHFTNQEVVAPYVVGYLLEHLDKGIGAAETAITLYRSNSNLANMVPPELLRGLVRQLAEVFQRRDVSTKHATELLRVLIVVKDEDVEIPILRNQSICMNQLLEVVSGRIHDSLTTHVKMQLQPTVSASADRRDGVATSGDGHSRKSVLGMCTILEILALCCQGRNTTTEIGGQSVMPLEKILSLLSDCLGVMIRETRDVIPNKFLSDSDDRSEWIPPHYLMKVLLMFLHNVYLNEGSGITDISDVQRNITDQKLQGLDKRRRVAEEWLRNTDWWIVFGCFSRLTQEWMDDFTLLERADTTMSSFTLRKASETSLNSLRSPILSHTNGDDGEMSDAPSPEPITPANLNHSTDDRRKLVFDDILPCVGTFMVAKFQQDFFRSRPNSKEVSAINEFVYTIISCTDDRFNERLSPKENTAIVSFFDCAQVLLPEDESAKFDSSTADLANSLAMANRKLRHKLGYSENEVMSPLTKRDPTFPSFSPSPGSTTSEGHNDPLARRYVADSFSIVQDYLLDTFVEDVSSLSMILVLIRKEMELIDWAASWDETIESSSRVRIPPPWLVALVQHLEDPELPEQVIIGLLKVFTRLIVTASIPVKTLEEQDILESTELPDLTDGESSYVETQNHLNRLGLTNCMVKLTERGNNRIAHEAICFGVELLHGGNKQVQDSMLDFFLNNDESFFEGMKDCIKSAADKLLLRAREQELFDPQVDQTKSISDLPPVAPSLGSIGKVLRLLQLVCEGHHLRLQNYIRLQEDNLKNTNIVQEVLLFLRTLLHTDGLITECRTLQESDKRDLLNLAEQTFDTLTEFCQGPCPENQNEIVGCNICGLVDGLLQAKGSHLLTLKSKAITTLLSVLEGSGSEGQGSQPPSVRIMLKTLKLETIESTMSAIWNLLKNREDESGKVFREMDITALKKRKAALLGPSAQKQEPQSHYVYEDSWMEEACEVLGVVEHVEKVESAESSKIDSGSLCSMLDVSFNIYILLLTLSGWSHSVATVIDELPGSMYFKRMVGTIEIARGSVLEKVYFRIPSQCSGLSRQARHDVLWELRDKDSRAAKLTSFFDISRELIAEMSYLHEIRSKVQHLNITQHKNANPFVNTVRYRLGQFFTSPGSQDHLRVWNVRAALVVNLILLLSYSVFEFHFDSEASELSIVQQLSRASPTERLGHGLVFLMPWMFQGSVPLEGVWDEFLVVLVISMCYLHVLISLSDVYLMWTLRLRRILREVNNKAFSERSQSELSFYSQFCLVREAAPKSLSLGFAWRFFLVLVSFGSVLHTPFYSALHLLAIIPQSTHLRNVVSAVSLNGQTLLMTFAFGVLVVYLFALLGYTAFHSDFVGDGGVENPNCLTLLQCFTFTLMNGMRSGGGVGDILSHTPLEDGIHHTQRMVFDYFFFIGVIVILLSIVSGIITDSFTELRKRKDDFEDEIRNYCFICGIEASTFERYLKGGFKSHTTKEHNMWNYLYFHCHVIEKDEDEYTGQESYVMDRIKELDFSFYPINKSMSMMELGVLEDKDVEDDYRQEVRQDEIRSELNSLMRRIDVMEQSMHQKFTTLTSHIENLDHDGRSTPPWTSGMAQTQRLPSGRLQAGPRASMI